MNALPPGDAARPLYGRIKDRIAARIRAGDWPPGMRLPSENRLVAELGCSRMTVHRALRELSAEGLVTRVTGVGTFVAEPRPRTELLELRNIAEEIHARGRRHDAEVHLLRAEAAPAAVAADFGMAEGARLFHSVILHRQDGVPVQLEDRWVDPAVAPDYLARDFTAENATAYLVRVAPLEALEHVVEADLPEPEAARLLEIAASAPCLVLFRRTWSFGRVATRSLLTHPGGRWRLGTRIAAGSP
ncbi:MAG: histidine utilization repressor, partial [Azospirillaceae bacterium]